MSPHFVTPGDGQNRRASRRSQAFPKVGALTLLLGRADGDGDLSGLRPCSWRRSARFQDGSVGGSGGWIRRWRRQRARERPSVEEAADGSGNKVALESDLVVGPKPGMCWTASMSSSGMA
jgi:hypothetical protein